MTAGERRARTGKGSGVRKSAPRVSPARLAASEVLRRVEEENAYSSLLLASNDDNLSAEDRALSYEIVLGCLRWQLWLDHLIEHYTGREPSRLDAPVRRALRVGLYQLRFLTRIPASAIVNESANLVHMARLRSAVGMVNAALRRAAREPDYEPSDLFSDPIERISVRWSHPVWLVRRWAAHFGLEETEKFAEANNFPPPVSFRVVRARGSSEEILDELRSSGAQLIPSRIAPDGWRVSGATARLRELARAGRIYIQDEASQLVAHALDAQRGERVLDACAAPGSKTTHIADRAGDEALIVAGDLYHHRLRTVVEAAARQGLKSVRVVEHDAERALPFAYGTFDRVLVDAPCTGTGTLRRNPEIRWRITERDVSDLSERQLRILRSAAERLRTSGRLIYSTCSVEPEENEQVVAAFLRTLDGWRQTKTPVPPFLQQEDGSARTWPHRDGSDGFFVAALERAR